MSMSLSNGPRIQGGQPDVKAALSQPQAMQDPKIVRQAVQLIETKLNSMPREDRRQVVASIAENMHRYPPEARSKLAVALCSRFESMGGVEQQKIASSLMANFDGLGRFGKQRAANTLMNNHEAFPGQLRGMFLDRFDAALGLFGAKENRMPRVTQNRVTQFLAQNIGQLEQPEQARTIDLFTSSKQRLKALPRDSRDTIGRALAGHLSNASADEQSKIVSCFAQNMALFRKPVRLEATQSMVANFNGLEASAKRTVSTHVSDRRIDLNKLGLPQEQLTGVRQHLQGRYLTGLMSGMSKQDPAAWSRLAASARVNGATPLSDGALADVRQKGGLWNKLDRGTQHEIGRGIVDAGFALKPKMARQLAQVYYNSLDPANPDPRWADWGRKHGMYEPMRNAALQQRLAGAVEKWGHIKAAMGGDPAHARYLDRGLRNQVWKQEIRPVLDDLVQRHALGIKAPQGLSKTQLAAVSDWSQVVDQHITQQRQNGFKPSASMERGNLSLGHWLERNGIDHWAKIQRGPNQTMRPEIHIPLRIQSALGTVAHEAVTTAQKLGHWQKRLGEVQAPEEKALLQRNVDANSQRLYKMGAMVEMAAAHPEMKGGLQRMFSKDDLGALKLALDHKRAVDQHKATTLAAQLDAKGPQATQAIVQAVTNGVAAGTVAERAVEHRLSLKPDDVQRLRRVVNETMRAVDVAALDEPTRKGVIDLAYTLNAEQSRKALAAHTYAPSWARGSINPDHQNDSHIHAMLSVIERNTGKLGDMDPQFWDQHPQLTAFMSRTWFRSAQAVRDANFDVKSHLKTGLETLTEARKNGYDRPLDGAHQAFQQGLQALDNVLSARDHREIQHIDLSTLERDRTAQEIVGAWINKARVHAGLAEIAYAQSSPEEAMKHAQAAKTLHDALAARLAVVFRSPGMPVNDQFAQDDRFKRYGGISFGWTSLDAWIGRLGRLSRDPAPAIAPR